MRNDLEAWVKALQQSLDELAAQDLGYPLGINEIRPPVTPIPALPHEFESLYAVCDGINLPDVQIGYFIDRALRTASASARGEPIQISARTSLDIHVFGTDGGGGRFALECDDGSVYHLPTPGIVKDGVFYEADAAVARRLAGSLTDFLWLLHADVDAFVRAQEDHVYMVS